jgi:hypothetical protein
MVLAQDEFSTCMARKIVNHVFSGQASTEDFDVVLRAFEGSRRFKPTLRAALLRFAERKPQASAIAIADPPAVAPEPQPDGLIPLPDSLRENLDNFCIECHDKRDTYPLTQKAFERDGLHVMLEYVAFGIMPKTPEGLDTADRLKLVNDFVNLLWEEPESREVAREFFTGEMLAHPVYRYSAAIATIAERENLGQTLYGPSVVEEAVRQPMNRYSPGYATATALAALTACKAKGTDEEDMQECVERATDPTTFILGSTE